LISTSNLAHGCPSHITWVQPFSLPVHHSDSKLNLPQIITQTASRSGRKCSIQIGVHLWNLSVKLIISSCSTQNGEYLCRRGEKRLFVDKNRHGQESVGELVKGVESTNEWARFRDPSIIHHPTWRSAPSSIAVTPANSCLGAYRSHINGKCSQWAITGIEP
jgi:hypothetical protein